jgi:thiol peroxidase
VDKVSTFSDHRDGAFGEAYGVLIKELRLLARAIFVVDKQGTVQYRQLVKEVSEEPNYEAVLEAVKKLV